MSLHALSAGVMVGVDLAYNLHSAFGNWFEGVKPLMIQARLPHQLLCPSTFL